MRELTQTNASFLKKVVQTVYTLWSDRPGAKPQPPAYNWSLLVREILHTSTYKGTRNRGAYRPAVYLSGVLFSPLSNGADNYQAGLLRALNQTVHRKCLDGWQTAIFILIAVEFKDKWLPYNVFWNLIEINKHCLSPCFIPGSALGRDVQDEEGKYKFVTVLLEIIACSFTKVIMFSLATSASG